MAQGAGDCKTESPVARQAGATGQSAVVQVPGSG